MRQWSFVTNKTLPEFIAMLNRDFADDRLLVMGKFQIAEDNPEATGTRITVKDAIDRYGDKIIEEIIDKGSYVIPRGRVIQVGPLDTESREELVKLIQSTAVEGETRPLSFNKKWCVDDSTHSWHWLVSERSLKPALGEWMNNGWYSGTEGVTIMPKEMYRRGWRWHSQVKIPKELRK